MATLYSLNDHSIQIIPQNFPAINAGARGKKIGSISITNDAETFTKQMATDGFGTFSKTNDKSGTITLSMNQTSSLFEEITDLFNYSVDNTEDALSTIVIKDKNGNVNATCNDCLIQKMPDYSAEAESADREVVFLSLNINYS